jgi:serine/threonine protein kinase
MYQSFNIGRVIGTGAYGIVNEIIHPFTGTHYALKETVPNFIEIDVLSRFQHQNIVSLVAFWIDKKFNIETDDDYSLYIMTELGHTTIYNCSDNIKRLSRDNLVTDMITAVHFLHSNGVIHCDIKPSNFIVVSTPKGPVAKLIDFGMSTYRDKPIHNCQTLAFAPPEILSLYYNVNIRDAKPHVSNMATDLWALASTIIYYFSGQYPFGITKDEIASNLREYYVYPQLYLIEKRVPSAWRDTIILLLELDPLERLNNMPEVVRNHNITVPIIFQQRAEINTKELLKYDSVLSTNSKLLYDTLNYYNFDAEIGFLAFELYYRILSVSSNNLKLFRIVPACIFLAFQLATFWESSPDTLFDYFEDLDIDPNDIIKTAGKIACKLKGRLYTPNLFTGVHDPNILSQNVKLLTSWKSYTSQQLLIKPPTLYKLRMPIKLLI